MYAIVDIETTGGSPSFSRITEIAIVLHDGHKIVDEYQTLINPHREIPPNIQRLTGISDEMVADAPSFNLIAEKIDEFTKDCVFVAHNVNFDYGFVRAAFQRLGISYRRRKLCTVRLSRKLLPGKFSYSLGKLCASENIPLSNRHRAMGDAKATAILFGKLLKVDQHDIIEQSLNPQSLEALLPPNLSKSEFLALPEEQGIYYFKDQKGIIVYIGQAKNIKKRVHSHFSGNSNTKSKYHFVKNIYGLDFKLVPNKLFLDVIEATEIKKHWPRHNRSLKRFTLNYGLYSYEDRNGYYRFNIGRSGKNDKPLRTFRNQIEAQEFLKELVIEFELCPRLSGLQPLGNGACSYYEDISCKGACCGKESSDEYNLRALEAIQKQINNKSTFVIKEPIENTNQIAILLVEKGRYKGFGTVSSKQPLNQIEKIKANITTAYDDQDMANLIHAYLAKHETQINYLN